MSKKVEIFCDNCNERCGTSKNPWWYIQIDSFPEVFTDYLDPFRCSGDFCCIECAIAYLEKHKNV